MGVGGTPVLPMMQQSAFLATPSSSRGRSRFSKALPAPPPLELNTDLSLTSTMSAKVLPAVPVLPPMEDFFSKPLDSPLPPVPLRSAATEGLPAISIARRPVGKQPPPVLPETSPSDSISSILSAYSRSSGESLIRSSVGDSSTKGSEPTLSPKEDEDRKDREKVEAVTSVDSSFFSKESVGYSMKDVSRYLLQERDPPPPPPKHAPRTSSLPQRPLEGVPPPMNPEKSAPTPANDAAPGSASSPPPQQQPLSPQLWRRRSLKTERNLGVPELKLTGSHGSTAASQPSKPQISYSPFPPAENSTAGPLLPPTTYGLPGRDIRPGASRDRSPEQGIMGQKVSKLKEKFHAIRSESHGDTQPPLTSHSETALPQVPNRLPTPEYQKEDVKTPIVDSIVSPVSPARSPEPTRQEAAQEQTRESSQEDPQTMDGAPIQKKVVGGPTLHGAKSLPEMKAPPGAQMQAEAQPPVPTDFGHYTGALPRNPRPESAPNRNQAQNSAVQFPPRRSSAARHGVGAASPSAPGHAQGSAPRGFSPGPAPRPPQGPAQGPTAGPARRIPDRGQVPPPAVQYYEQRTAWRPRRDPNTEYKDVNYDELPSPPPGASHFPKQREEPAAESAAIQPPPLKGSHYNCYWRHRESIWVQNRHHPVACQSCKRAEIPDFRRCGFCGLRICQPCFRFLIAFDYDLERLTEFAARHPERISPNPESAPSSQPSSRPSSRPGSDGMLQTVQEAAE